MTMFFSIGTGVVGRMCRWRHGVTLVSSMMCTLRNGEGRRIAEGKDGISLAGATISRALINPTLRFSIVLANPFSYVVLHFYLRPQLSITWVSLIVCIRTFNNESLLEIYISERSIRASWRNAADTHNTNSSQVSSWTDTPFQLFVFALSFKVLFSRQGVQRVYAE